jgi:hypothetical protein
LLCQLRQGVARLFQNSRLTRRRTKTRDDQVDIEGVEFDAVAEAPGLLGRDECGPRPEERVDDELAPARYVEKRVLAS